MRAVTNPSVDRGRSQNLARQRNTLFHSSICQINLAECQDNNKQNCLRVTPVLKKMFPTQNQQLHLQSVFLACVTKNRPAVAVSFWWKH